MRRRSGPIFGHPKTFLILRCFGEAKASKDVPPSCVLRGSLRSHLRMRSLSDGSIAHLEVAA